MLELAAVLDTLILLCYSRRPLHLQELKSLLSDYLSYPVFIDEAGRGDKGIYRSNMAGQGQGQGGYDSSLSSRNLLITSPLPLSLDIQHILSEMAKSVQVYGLSPSENMHSYHFPSFFPPIAVLNHLFVSKNPLPYVPKTRSSSILYYSRRISSFGGFFGVQRRSRRN